MSGQLEQAPAQDEREAFEAHMRLGGYGNPEKHQDGSYVSSAMELWWQGWKARATRPAQTDPWQPSGADYDRAIHNNPDAKAWADLFVDTFPGLKDKHDLMIGWFANAMMAMHDHLARKTAPQPELVMPVALGSVNADYDKGWADHAAEVRRLNAELLPSTPC